MSKRQTTGLPDKAKVAAQRPAEEKGGLDKFIDNVLGNPKNHQEREDAINRVITRAIAVSAAVIGVLIVFAVIYDQVWTPSRAVATINGETITVAEFRDGVRFERARLTEQVNSFATQLQQFGLDANQYFQQEPYKTWLNELNFPDQLGSRVLDDMINAELARQEAVKLGINVDEAAVQGKINDFFGYDPTKVALTGAEPTATLTPTITVTPYVSPTPSPTPTATLTPTVTPEGTAEATAETTEAPTATDFPTSTPAPTQSIEEQQKDFETLVSDYTRGLREQSSVSQDVIDNYFKQQALQDAIGDYLLGEAGKTTYVKLRHILVATEEEALDVIDALKAGESFADLAGSVSTDSGSAQSGGVYDWAPALNYVKEFKEASLTLPIGEISAPVKTDFGYHVMQVIGREDRVVEDANKDSVKQALYSAWLDSLRTANEANIQKSSDWPNYVPSN